MGSSFSANISGADTQRGSTEQVKAKESTPSVETVGRVLNQIIKCLNTGGVRFFFFFFFYNTA
jgi:hypothetical protein